MREYAAAFQRRPDCSTAVRDGMASIQNHYAACMKMLLMLSMRGADISMAAPPRRAQRQRVRCGHVAGWP